MATVTLLTSDQANVGGGETSRNTASVTIVAGRAYVFGVSQQWSGVEPTLTGLSQTWTRRAVTPYSAVGNLVTVFGVIADTSTSGVLTINWASATWAKQWALLEITDPAVSPWVQAPVSETTGNATTSVNYPNAWAADSVGIAFAGTNSGALTSTPRSGWTEAADVTTSGEGAMSVQYRLTADTSAANTWSGTANGAIAALELGTAAAPPSSSVPVFLHHLRTQGIS